jgi:AraC-like DNA-binding protein
LPEKPDRNPGINCLVAFHRWSSKALTDRAADQGARIGTALQDHGNRDEHERLTDPDIPISAIANELGFVDVPSFHRAFRGWTGMTPSAYRHTADEQRSASA